MAWLFHYNKSWKHLVTEKILDHIQLSALCIGRNMFRSSHRRCSVRKGVLKYFAKFTGRHLCHSLFFNKVAGLRSATLLKKRLWHRCFPVNFGKSLRTPLLQNTSGRLLESILSGKSEVYSGTYQD